MAQVSVKSRTTAAEAVMWAVPEAVDPIQPAALARSVGRWAVESALTFAVAPARPAVMSAARRVPLSAVARAQPRRPMARALAQSMTGALAQSARVSAEGSVLSVAAAVVLLRRLAPPA